MLLHTTFTVVYLKSNIHATNGKELSMAIEEIRTEYYGYWKKRANTDLINILNFYLNHSSTWWIFNKM